MLFDDLEGVCAGVVLARGLAFRETGNAEVILMADRAGASDPDLGKPVSALFGMTFDDCAIQNFFSSFETYRGCDVGRADVADVLQPAVRGPHAGLLPDNAHSAASMRLSQGVQIVRRLFLERRPRRTNG